MKTRAMIEAEIANLNYLIAREERIGNTALSMGGNYSTQAEGCAKRIERMRADIKVLKEEWNNVLPDPPKEVEVDWDNWDL